MAVSIVLAVVVAALVLSAPLASADHLCGATVTEDVVLEHDLECAGAGITIGADGITIRLNGHTMSGPVAGTTPAVSGIIVNGRADVSIVGPGTIEGFFAGVRIVGSSDALVADLTVVGSHEAGIRLENSMHVEIIGNTAYGGEHDAIQLRNSHENVIIGNVATATDPTGCAVNLVSSNDNLVKGNSLSNSGTSAVQFARIAGLPPSSGNVILKNTLSDSTHGVRLFAGATGNVVAMNEISENVNGISFVGPLPEALGNTFVRNVVADNTCGVKGSSTELAGNRILKNNVFSGNDSDECLE